MTNRDKEIFEALKYNDRKDYWYYIVPTSVRRSGEYKISHKKYNSLKQQYEKAFSKMETQTPVEWLVEQLYKDGHFTVGVSHTEVENLKNQAKEIELKQSNKKIDLAISEFTKLKSKSTSLRDSLYLDGVLAVLDSIKEEKHGGDK